jgi:hypothetical protein
MKSSWSKLQDILSELYFDCGHSNDFERDLPDLTEAYHSVEDYWQKALKNLSLVRLVILAEAPLFGKEKRAYFYNPSAGATSFFYYKDAEALVGPLKQSSRKVNGVRPKKVEMIRKLTAAGVVILDLFPFSFKEKVTAVDYPGLAKLGKYKSLFEKTMLSHFLPKIEWLRPKIDGNTTYTFRYARLENRLQPVVKRVLVEKDFLVEENRVHSIHLQRQLNREKLVELYNGSADA